MMVDLWRHQAVTSQHRWCFRCYASYTPVAT